MVIVVEIQTNEIFEQSSGTKNKKRPEQMSMISNEIDLLEQYIIYGGEEMFACSINLAASDRLVCDKRGSMRFVLDECTCAYEHLILLKQAHNMQLRDLQLTVVVALVWGQTSQS